MLWLDPYLIVFADIPERLLENVVVTDLELYIEGLPEGLPDLLVAANGGLPAIEADGAHDLVDSVDDVVDDDWGLLGFECVEEL